MVKSIVQPYILCVLGYIGMPGVSACQSHSVSAFTSTCLCRAHTCAHRKPRCCYSNYTSRCSFFSLRSMQLRVKNYQHTRYCILRQRAQQRGESLFIKPLHASLPVPVVSSTSARIMATTTDTSYLCLGSACHKPEQFTAPSRTKVNQLRIISKQDSHCQLLQQKSAHSKGGHHYERLVCPSSHPIRVYVIYSHIRDPLDKGVSKHTTLSNGAAVEGR